MCFWAPSVHGRAIPFNPNSFFSAKSSAVQLAPIFTGFFQALLSQKGPWNTTEPLAPGPSFCPRSPASFQQRRRRHNWARGAENAGWQRYGGAYCKLMEWPAPLAAQGAFCARQLSTIRCSNLLAQPDRPSTSLSLSPHRTSRNDFERTRLLAGKQLATLDEKPARPPPSPAKHGRRFPFHLPYSPAQHPIPPHLTQHQHHGTGRRPSIIFATPRSTAS